jgi:alpha-mannosidase
MALTGGRIFSYVLNNYWHTNYPAAQGGPLTFSYHLTSGARIGEDRAFRLGWQARRPLYAQRMNFQDFHRTRVPYDARTGGTLAIIGTEQVVVTTLKRARWADGWIVRLREIAGHSQIAPVTVPGKRVTRAWLTNLLEQEIEELPVEPAGTVRVPVPAWGLVTVRITMAEKSDG